MISSPPLRLLALLLAVAGIVALTRNHVAATRERFPCDPVEGLCDSSYEDEGVPAPPARTIPALEFCRDVGYLCAPLTDGASMRVQRWKGFEGIMVVHVPLPDFEEPGAATELQRAAARGIRAWNHQPFPILADLRGDRDPDFTVRWTRSLGGNQLGLARTRWSARGGLSVVAVDLVTRHPFNADAPADPRQVQLTAAHEMGHALGLPHSATPTDVMYPINTATSMSAQDYRTVEVLYRTPDGTMVTR